MTATGQQVATRVHPIRSPSVRRWLAGLGISLIGDQVYFIALAWTAVQTAGPGTAGVILAVGAIPRAALMLLGGVIADRFGPRRVLIGSDSARLVVMILVAVLLTWSNAGVVILFAVSIIFGIVDALFQPAIGALPPRLVEPDQLLALQGLRTLIYRTAVILGAPIGGLFLAGPGVVAAFVFNAATFAASMIAVLTLRLRPIETTASDSGPRSLRADLIDGLRHAKASPIVMPTVALVFMLELGLSGTLNIGMPLLTEHQGWSASSLGILLGGFGLGATAAALTTATRRSQLRGPIFTIGGIISALSMAALPWTTHPWAGAAATAVIGAAAAVMTAAALAVVQATTDDKHLGRVMSLFAFASTGSLPLANALTGAVADATSTTTALLTNAGITALAAVVGLRISAGHSRKETAQEGLGRADETEPLSLS
ncbi:MFS transporter [Catellatospora citrea]|uniref:MFS transporter n=1 Tax=Catellatospora citrea TaxID=53366 RepID=UPI0033CD7131